MKFNAKIAFLVLILMTMLLPVACRQPETPLTKPEIPKSERPKSEIDECSLPDYVITECPDNLSGCMSEKLVVCDLLNKSEPFASFYKAERHKMPAHIHWIKKPDLPESRRGVTLLADNITYLKRIPPRVEDAFLIAHELCAYLTFYFPYTRPIEEPKSLITESAGLDVEDVHIWLNEMFKTPYRDSILRDCGFSLENVYREYSEDFLITQYPFDNDAQRLCVLFMYVRLELYWRDVLGRTKISDVQIQCKNWYPEAEVEGEHLIEIIRARGYDNPDKMEELYKYIIEKYRLYKIMRLFIFDTQNIE